MKYTIKDISEGKCAVKNDGTLIELQEVLRLAFPKTRVPNFGDAAYYLRSNYKHDTWIGMDNISAPTQSVKDFLVNKTTEYKGKAVQCKTQNQWDFVSKKLGRVSSTKYLYFGDCINIDTPNESNTADYFTKDGYQVITFQEWLSKNNYIFVDKPKFIEGTWYESDCGEYYGKFLNENQGEKYPDEFPCKEYIIINSKTYYSNGNYFDVSSFTKVRLAPMEEVNKYLPKKEHSWKDYKEGDYVVITEFEGKADWGNHWFMPGEVLKLGGNEWQVSIKNSFDACSKKYPKGNGMSRTFEENYKIRKATQEEINNSQWSSRNLSYIKDSSIIVGSCDPYVARDFDIDSFFSRAITKKSHRKKSDEVVDSTKLKIKIELIKVKSRQIIK